jgi:hypothetical protein
MPYSEPASPNARYLVTRVSAMTASNSLAYITWRWTAMVRSGSKDSR